MSTVLTAAIVSAALGLLLPARRHLRWAGTACAITLLAACAVILLTEGLMLAGDFKTPLVTGTVATAMLLPAFWLARSAGQPPAARDDDDEGGGGPGEPPPGPEPGPPDDALDWTAFDEARESWVSRERELAGV